MAALPETGISLSLVKRTLGAASDDLSALCRHANINMFSRHKPVVYPGVPLEDSFWSAAKKNFGIVIPEMQDDIVKTGWRYQRPSGGASSPYRLGDFRGYNHQAGPVLRRMENSFKVDLSGESTLIVTFTTPGEISPEEICIEYSAGPGDIMVSSLGGLHLAMKVRDIEKKEVLSVQCNDNIASHGLSLTASLDTLPAGMYELYFYLTTPDRHVFPFYEDEYMPNPCPLEVVRSIVFDFSVSGLIDTANKRHPLSDRIDVHFPGDPLSRRGFYIVTSMRNLSPEALTLTKSKFTVAMQPDLFAGGEYSVSLTGLMVDPTAPAMEIPAGGTAEIRFYFAKCIASGELIPLTEDIKTSIAYAGESLWQGTILITAILT